MSDYDAPSACWETRPRARKTHRCDECYNDILPGEHYQKIAGVWGGEFDHWKTCAACERVRDWMTVQGQESFLGGVYEVLSDSGLDEEIPPLLLLAMQAT